MHKWTGGVRRAVKAKKETKESMQREFFKKRTRVDADLCDDENAHSPSSYFSERKTNQVRSLDIRSLLSEGSRRAQSSTERSKRLKIETPSSDEDTVKAPKHVIKPVTQSAETLAPKAGTAKHSTPSEAPVFDEQVLFFEYVQSEPDLTRIVKV
jgi:hypothetical protein